MALFLSFSQETYKFNSSLILTWKSEITVHSLCSTQHHGHHWGERGALVLTVSVKLE